LRQIYLLFFNCKKNIFLPLFPFTLDILTL